jgi:hypothetical protein
MQNCIAALKRRSCKIAYTGQILPQTKGFASEILLPPPKHDFPPERRENQGGAIAVYRGVQVPPFCGGAVGSTLAPYHLRTSASQAASARPIKHPTRGRQRLAASLNPAARGPHTGPTTAFAGDAFLERADHGDLHSVHFDEYQNYILTDTLVCALHYEDPIGG